MNTCFIAVFCVVIPLDGNVMLAMANIETLLVPKHLGSPDRGNQQSDHRINAGKCSFAEVEFVHTVTAGGSVKFLPAE